MSTIVATEVFTITELVERGDESAVDRALSWMLEAWDDAFVSEVSEVLADSLRAANLSGLRITSWDYYRGYVTVDGYVTGECFRSMPPGHFLGRLTFAGHEWVERIEFDTPRARDYGRNTWIDLDEDAPFDWADEEYDALVSAAERWRSRVESLLADMMTVWFDELTDRDRLIEVADANGYTFTADGKRFG